MVLTKTQWGRVNITAELTSITPGSHKKKTRRKSKARQSTERFLPAPTWPSGMCRSFLKKPRPRSSFSLVSSIGVVGIVSAGREGAVVPVYYYVLLRLPLALLPKQRDDSSGLRQGKASIRSSPCPPNWFLSVFLFVFFCLFVLV